LEERSEDDLGAVGHGKSHPQNQDELEDVVEWKPVDGVDEAFENGQERVHDPVRQPLSVINFTRAEQCLERVVARNDEAGEIDQELASNVEEDEEEVESPKAEDDIDLGHAGLSLEVVEHRIFAQLLIHLGDLVLGFVLERHLDGGVVFVLGTMEVLWW